MNWLTEEVVHEAERHSHHVRRCKLMHSLASAVYLCHHLGYNGTHLQDDSWCLANFAGMLITAKKLNIGSCYCIR
jgi:hypothetical protein